MSTSFDFANLKYRKNSRPAWVDKVAVTIDFIEPSDAEFLLQGNVNNYRKIKPKVVRKYSADMLAGRWGFDGTPITITEEGVLSNGQHRLSAVVESGCGQWFLVVRGLQPGSEALAYTDTGCKRNLPDHLTKKGVHSAAAVAAGVRLLCSLRAGMRKESVLDPTESEIEQIITQNESLAIAVEMAATAFKRLTPSVAVAFTWLALHDDFDLATEACEVVSGARATTTDHPFAKLSEQILTAKSKASKVMRTMARDWQLSLIFAAWEHLKKGNTVKILRPAKRITYSPAMRKALQGLRDDTQVVN